MIKKHLKIYVPIIILFFVVSTFSVYAIEYVKLEPDAFMGLEEGAKTGNQLADFLGQVFSFGIAIAVVLALIMLIYAGILKMTTDSWTKHDDANTAIENALYGLGLALVSYIILYTINPCIVIYTARDGCSTTNTFLFAPGSTPAPVEGGEVNNDDQTPTNSSNIRKGKPANEVDNPGLSSDINIVSTGNCNDYQIRTCTSTEGLRDTTINTLNDMARNCGNECFFITGGTEIGHKSHRVGDTVYQTVDIRYDPKVIEMLDKQGLKETLDENDMAKFVGPSTRNNYTCEPVESQHSAEDLAVRCDSPEAKIIHVQF